jgi:hypothetical protein
VTQHHILDGCKQFASYNIKEKIESKGSQMGHTKKLFRKVVVTKFPVLINVVCFFESITQKQLKQTYTSLLHI